MKLLSQIKTVLWAFLGVRSKAGKDEDMKNIQNPLVFLAIGFIIFVVFVIGLMWLVNLVVSLNY